MPLTDLHNRELTYHPSEVVWSRTEHGESSLFFALSSALVQAISLSAQGFEKPIEMPHMLRKGQRMGQRAGAGISLAAEYSTFHPESLVAQLTMRKRGINSGVD